MMAATGALLNEIIRSGYPPMEQQLGMNGGSIPFGFSDDTFISYDSEDIGSFAAGYPDLVPFDWHRSMFPFDDSNLDFDVFDFILNQDAADIDPAFNHPFPDPLESYASLTTPLASPTHPSLSPCLPPSFPCSPTDVYGLFNQQEDDSYSSPPEEEEEEMFRNIPTFVVSGIVSEDERDEDDDDDYARKTHSRLNSKLKTENQDKYVVPRTITDVIAENNATPVPRRVRRRKDQLWYFLLEILGDPEYNPNYIQWENKEQGIFRFIESKKVAQLWGAKKKRSGMTYEYFARAMRHYYSRGIMRRVTGRRLVYQFGPKAENWRGYAQQVAISRTEA